VHQGPQNDDQGLHKIKGLKLWRSTFLSDDAREVSVVGSCTQRLIAGGCTIQSSKLNLLDSGGFGVCMRKLVPRSREPTTSCATVETTRVQRMTTRGCTKLKSFWFWGFVEQCLASCWSVLETCEADIQVRKNYRSLKGPDSDVSEIEIHSDFKAQIRLPMSPRIYNQRSSSADCDSARHFLKRHVDLPEDMPPQRSKGFISSFLASCKRKVYRTVQGLQNGKVRNGGREHTGHWKGLDYEKAELGFQTHQIDQASFKAG
jgi:hypothetical protein